MAGYAEIPDIYQLSVDQVRATDWWIRQVPCQGLAEGGPASPETLQAVFISQETLESNDLLQGCASFSESRRGKRWAEFWLNLLSSRESYVRGAALIALHDLVETMAEVRKSTLERLGDDDEGVRQAAL